MAHDIKHEMGTPLEEGATHATMWAIEKGVEKVAGPIPAKVAGEVVKTYFGEVIKDSVKITIAAMSEVENEPPIKRAFAYAMSPIILGVVIASRLFNK